MYFGILPWFDQNHCVSITQSRFARWYTFGGFLFGFFGFFLLTSCLVALRRLLSGKIPPESTLTFIVEVLEIRNGPRSHESFQEMDLNDDWRLSRSEVKSGAER